MKLPLFAAIAFIFLTPQTAFAEGDPEEGERLFLRCAGCHSIINDAGEELYPRGGITGPNLYNVFGRVAGTEPAYLNGDELFSFNRYTDDMIAAGATGLVWSEETLADFVENPIPYIREYLGDETARVNMSLRHPNGSDIAAYLRQFSN